MKPKVNIRNSTAGDEDGWFRLLTEAYRSPESRSIDDVRHLVSSEDFSSNWLFLAEADKETVGSIRKNLFFLSPRT